MGVKSKLEEFNYITQLIDENASGGNQEIGAAFYMNMISNFITKVIKTKTVVLGSLTVNGNLIKVSNLNEKISYIIEQGAKFVYLPISNQPDVMILSPDIWSKVSLIFYVSP
ncbi:putative ATP-dependent Lon-type protease [Clostridium algifaecis]|uniref:ATP-dependent Lon-type protease n=1 Tax=Clostridium algifaecis TaxID=1472040 RepID=A0ABS4KTB5_9CLOT|nr:S16 family serine protease [Clostridium algifaecis]MBP2033302.1 putative ATP-dependent Lon-type protease [Clostridium algifaecis]